MITKIDWDTVHWNDVVMLYDGEPVRFVERIGTSVIVAGRGGRRVVQEYQCTKHYPSHKKTYGGKSV